MIVDLTDVLTCENKQREVEVHIEFQSFDSKLGSFPIIESAPFTLRLANVENKTLKIAGESQLKVVIPCGRCLEDVQQEIHFEIDKEIPLNSQQSNEEDETDDADYMTGCNLDVDKLIYGEILVNWPMKVLCKEDCKGICKRCGINLNLQVCDCEKTELDPRMAAIQDIFNKFKEV